MSASGSDSSIRTLFQVQALGGLNVGQTIVALILLPIAAFFGGLSRLITVTFDVLVIPAANFAEGVGNLVFAIFGGLAFVIGEAAGAQGESFRQGILGLFSPFALPFGTLVILTSLLLIAFYLEIEATSDLIPGAVTDYFGLGAEEEA